MKLNLEPQMPADAITYEDGRHGVQITFPSDWHRARRSLTPRLSKPGGILAVGTFPLKPEPGRACSRAPDLPQVEMRRNDALVHVEVQPDEGAAAAPDRPRPFDLLKQVRPLDPTRPAAGQVFPWNCLNRVGIVGRWTFFGADRRVFYVTAVAGESTSADTRREVLGVLESLKFG